jgi:phenylacetic acid degradation operon negative regulatory protein
VSTGRGPAAFSGPHAARAGGDGVAAAGTGLLDALRGVLAAQPPRAPSLVITVFGDAVAPHGGAVWLSGLIELLASFEISERLVRTSVFRLAEEGWLESRREGRRSVYALTPAGLRRFEHAYRRIYAPPTGAWDGSWTMVLLPRGGDGSHRRAELRRELGGEGFAAVAQGTFAHPRADAASLREILETLELRDEAFVFAARAPEGAAGRPLRDLVAQCWPLDRLAADYERFVASFAPLAAAVRAAAPALDAREAFMLRTLLIHAFRRVILHDPLLPAELLPARWPGHAAYALCRELYQLTYRPAEAFLVATLAGVDGGALPGLGAGFYARFGGI